MEQNWQNKGMSVMSSISNVGAESRKRDAGKTNGKVDKSMKIDYTNANAWIDFSYDDLAAEEEKRYNKKCLFPPVLTCDFCRIVNKQIIGLQLDNYFPEAAEAYKCPHCGSKYTIDIVDLK